MDVDNMSPLVAKRWLDKEVKNVAKMLKDKELSKETKDYLKMYKLSLEKHLNKILTLINNKV